MSSYPPGAAGDPFAPYNMDSEPDNSTLEQAFADFSGLFELYRGTYKYTDCGPSMGALIREWVEVPYEEPVIEWRGDDPVQVGTTTVSGSKQVDRWFYCDNLFNLGSWKDMRDEGQLVLALSVSSIVEGVEQTTDNIVIEIDHEGDPEDLKARFYEALEEVDKQANDVWKDTHGCPTCARHWWQEAGTLNSDFPWQGADDPRWEVGETQVWDDCPECKGQGTSI